jgi:hypothetical protein
MKKSLVERTLVKFSTLDPFINEITVYRVLPDNSEEPIGKVFPDLRNEEDSVIYVSTNNHGEEIFPPTSDFVGLENMFEKYAKELAEKSLVEGLEAEVDEYEKREEAMNSIRNWKINNKEIQQINL